MTQLKELVSILTIENTTLKERNENNEALLRKGNQIIKYLKTQINSTPQYISHGSKANRAKIID